MKERKREREEGREGREGRGKGERILMPWKEVMPGPSPFYFP